MLLKNGYVWSTFRGGWNWWECFVEVIWLSPRFARWGGRRFCGEVVPDVKFH